MEVLVFLTVKMGANAIALITDGNRGIGFAIARGLPLKTGIKWRNSDVIPVVSGQKYCGQCDVSRLGENGYGLNFCSAIARTRSRYGNLVGKVSTP
jgi:hypothetical protein